MLTVKQDSKDIYKSTQPGQTLAVSDVMVTNGAIFWGHGGDSVTLKNVQSEGDVWKYRICNFDHPLKSMHIDNTGVKCWITQGPNEAAVRMMQVETLEVHGLWVRGHKTNGTWWKQCIQDRSGGTHKWFNCQVDGLIDIGWMTDPTIPIVPLALSYWENCTMLAWPNIHPGVKRVQFVNCTIAGAHVSNHDKTYP